MGTSLNKNDSWTWTIADQILHNQSMLAVCASDSYITLYIVGDSIFFNNGVGILNNKDTFLMIFINFIFEDEREGFFGNFYSWFFIKTYKIVINNFCSIIFTLYKNSILFVSSNADILLDVGLTKHLFVGSAYYPILTLLVNSI